MNAAHNLQILRKYFTTQINLNAKSSSGTVMNGLTVAEATLFEVPSPFCSLSGDAPPPPVPMLPPLTEFVVVVDVGVCGVLCAS